MAATTRLFNPIDLIHWNLRRDYVGKLVAAGIRVPQSHVVPCDAAAIAKVLADAGWDRAVVKPASGASGHFAELVKRATLLKQVAGLSDEARASGVIVQEFLPEIAEGELSLVYFDGVLSHAIRKRPPRANSAATRAMARRAPRRRRHAK